MIVQVAQQFAGPGIVFKIDVHNAKDIQPFSYYGNMEGELLLSPNMVSPRLMRQIAELCCRVTARPKRC